MTKKVSAYCCFIPIGIYAAYSLSLQLLFDVPFMAKSMLLSVIPSAIYIFCFWKLRSSKKGMNLKATLLFNTLLAGLLRRVRISTLRNENETFSQLNSITYIGVFCVW